MTVRPARPEEAPELTRLARAAKASWRYDEALLRMWAADLTVSPETIAARPTFVAEEQAGIVGFCQVDNAAARWELVHLWVLPASQRHGVGRALLQRALSAAAAAGQTTLTVEADPNAEPFYLACGARRTGATPAALPGQPDRIRPQLEIPMDPHQANRSFWDATTPWWKDREDARGLWQRAPREPALVLCPAELALFADVPGRSVCVLGSGDNEVAFALAGMGGRVTSVDISQQRLDVAAARARTLGLQLTFVRADVVALSMLSTGSFDFVYAGGHITIWISDLRGFFREAVRILRPGGLFVVNEYHPVRRTWADVENGAPTHAYFNRGPYRYTSPEGLPSFEYQWTVEDHIQSMIDAGCRIVRVHEHGEQIPDEFWTREKLDRLPGYLLVAGRKE
jgi:ubiquinone/menaquinone biosynthesis C-methylase UbiE/GNAT superfamily N-acetyltransferase